MRKTVFLFTLGLFACHLASGKPVSLRHLGTGDIAGIDIRTAAFRTGDAAEVLPVRFREDDLRLRMTPTGLHYLGIRGYGSLARAGEPALPVMTRRLVLPAGSAVTGLRLLRPEFAEVDARLNLAPARGPMPLTGAAPGVYGGAGQGVYSTSAYYPGGALSYVSGSDGRRTVVYIRLYPVQYNPAEGRAVLIKEAQIEVHYDIEPPRAPAASPRFSDARNVILTTSTLLAPAESLRVLHEDLEGVASDVVTVEHIDTVYAEAEVPLQPGYANMSGGPVTGAYDYSLARKVVSFLRDTASHPDLVSVTILGDALEVPPSYYFYVPQYTEYNNWIVSDLFYASPDYDMVLNYQVGRLPVSTVDEALAIVDKYRTYKAGLDAGWFHNAAVFGGATFNTLHLYGEMGIVHALEEGCLEGQVIEKNFHSNFRENRDVLVPHFTDENTGIVFASGHGSGVSYIMTTTTMHSTEFGIMPPTARYPLLFMVACLNGSYDAEIVPNGYARCYGERALASAAGPVAFWGASRTAFVGYDYRFDEAGRLDISGSRYLSGMLINCLKAYSYGAASLGEIAAGAFDEYMLIYEPENYVDRVTAYEYVFLGDPAISVPPAPASPGCDSVLVEAEPPPDAAGHGFDEPVYNSTTSFSPTVTLEGHTGSPTVSMSICRLSPGMPTVTEEVSLVDDVPPFTCDFAPPGEGVFLVSFEAACGRESRLYFRTELTDNIPPTACDLLAIVPEGDSYDLLWSSSFDREGGDITYTLREFANPAMAADSCDSMDNWQSLGFSVASGGLGGTGCFWSGRGNSLSNTLVTPVPVAVGSGDSLVFYKKYFIEDSWDYAYAEVSLDGSEFAVLEKYTGTSGDWTRTALDLGAYAGDSVFIRFRYTTDFVIAKDGFYLDNVAPAVWFEEITTTEDIPDTTYRVSMAPAGRFCYQVKAVDEGGAESAWSHILGIVVDNAGLAAGGAAMTTPDRTVLRASSPNPFRSSTHVSFGLAAPGVVEIEVYSPAGRLVRRLAEGHRDAGWHSLNWDGRDVRGNPAAPGVYFVRMRAPGFTDALKVVLLR
jgi:hypothetical protein